jgi:hypothetical protein
MVLHQVPAPSYNTFVRRAMRMAEMTDSADIASRAASLLFTPPCADNVEIET